MAHVHSINDTVVERMESMDTWKQEGERHNELQDFDSFVENFGLDIASALYANRPALKTVYELLVSTTLLRIHAPPKCPVCHRVGVSVLCHVGQGTGPVDLREAYDAIFCYIWLCFSAWDESLLVLRGAASVCLSPWAFIPRPCIEPSRGLRTLLPLGPARPAVC